VEWAQIILRCQGYCEISSVFALYLSCSAPLRPMHGIHRRKENFFSFHLKNYLNFSCHKSSVEMKCGWEKFRIFREQLSCRKFIARFNNFKLCSLFGFYLNLMTSSSELSKIYSPIYFLRIFSNFTLRK
jgi:hypothetical protein